jgi:hypothetical protein
VKAATAKAATARAATVKAATAAKDAAVAKVASRASAGRSAAAAKAATKATTATGTPAAMPTPASRATPVARPVATPAAVKATAPAKAIPAENPAAATVTPPATATPSAKPTPAQATSTAAKATAVKAPAPAPAATGTHRPTPYRRTPVEQPAAVRPVVVTDGARSASDPAVVEAAAVLASMAEGVRSPVLRRRPPTLRPRPALYLAAALVGALGVSVASTSGPSAQATDTISHSVSVAHELGIDGTPTEAVIDPAGTERLEELAVSRNTRDAEQTAAAAVQAEADQAAVEAARPKAVLPVNGARLTSGFGARWGTLHAGIDLAAPIGTPEYAAMDGVVLEAGPASGFGLAVYIQHENGDVTVYGHMEKILVQAGQVVKAGETIALLGNRGQSTGPHLHFEVHVGGLNGKKIDPRPWLRERGIDI